MKDFKNEIAEKFIRAMEQETAPWQRPWESSPFSLINGVTGHEYRGMNVLILSICMYNDPRYCTFKQAIEAGYKIKKGSKGSLISYCGFFSPKDDEEENEDEKIFMRKSFCVFNFEQMEGVPELQIEKGDFDPIPKCEEVLKNFDLKIEENVVSDRAFYRLNDDRIFVPNRERFVDELSFYHTVFHKMAHATGAPHRLNRKFGTFASKNYAFEERVAEITSFLVGRALGCGRRKESDVASGLNRSKMIAKFCLRPVNWLKRLVNGF